MPYPDAVPYLSDRHRDWDRRERRRQGWSLLFWGGLAAMLLWIVIALILRL